MATAHSTIKVILLDIEGTVCPISFVKDVLFPYALEALPEVLKSRWDSVQFASYRKAFPADYADSPADFEEHVRDLVARDVKAPYLKSLQGYLWENGYKTGRLRAPLFADVEPHFRAWRRNRLRVMIYSSGSVPAQKLLFKHVEPMSSQAASKSVDLTPLITDFFDTVKAGPKMEAASYKKIAAKYSRYPPAEWLFLSDNVTEVEAAQEAGMQSYVVLRPGNAPLAEDIKEKHKVIETFDELDAELGPVRDGKK